MDEKMAAARFDDAAKNLGTLGSRFKLPDKIKACAQEIRLRAGRPVTVSLPGGPVFLLQSGEPVYTMRSGLLCAERENIEEAFRILCDCSVHSHQREISNGFITLRGGHRAGICGTAVTDGDSIANIREISSVNLRVARDIRGAATETVQALLHRGTIPGTLIFGPPGCGKTTVLRDLARQLSSGTLGKFFRVAVVDERGEIAATYQGMPQNDLGPCCDVLDGYPKGEGIMHAVRCLSPDVVICDEIGGESDERAVEFSLNAGVTVIASAHAGSIGELLARPQTSNLIASGAFKRAVHLSGREHPGVVDGVFGEESLQKARYGTDLKEQVHMNCC